MLLHFTVQNREEWNTFKYNLCDAKTSDELCSSVYAITLFNETITIVILAHKLTQHTHTFTMNIHILHMYNLLCHSVGNT